MADHSAALAPSELDSSISIGASLVGLSAILRPGINVSVFQRELTPELSDEAARLRERTGFHMLAVVAPGAKARSELASHLSGLDQLSLDVAMLVEVLSDLTGCDLVGVRLARVDRAMCPRLHVDHVTLRLVCSYAGPGTQYVENSALDRSRLGHAARGATDEESGLLRRGALVRAADSGDVVLLKGERWPGQAGRGAVHRSPSACAERPRLVLTLDPLGSPGAP